MCNFQERDKKEEWLAKINAEHNDDIRDLRIDLDMMNAQNAELTSELKALRREQMVIFFILFPLLSFRFFSFSYSCVRPLPYFPFLIPSVPIKSISMKNANCSWRCSVWKSITRMS